MTGQQEQNDFFILLARRLLPPISYIPNRILQACAWSVPSERIAAAEALDALKLLNLGWSLIAVSRKWPSPQIRSLVSAVEIIELRYRKELVGKR